MSPDLDTPVENTWCAGCGNFGILQAVKMSLNELVEEGESDIDDFVMSSGIGCHAKIFDYLNMNGFYSIHGRVPPTITGIKVGNPELNVIGFSGDGDAYAEGVSHMIHAAKRNIDATMIVHDNRVFALTTGQFTPTSPKGFAGKSTPQGSVEDPINPLHLMLASEASFVARGFPGELTHLKDLLKKGINHPGFAVIDVLQPCVTFYNLWSYLKESVYKLSEEGHDENDFQAAWGKAEENEDRVPIGLFYKEEREIFNDQILEDEASAKESASPDIEKVVQDYT